jgi:outer membrane protein OmpA-like peptidoglycan-associated protein
MRNIPASVPTLIAILLVPMSVAAQPSPAAPWGPPPPPTPAPAAIGPAPTNSAPGNSAPAPAPAPSPNYWNASPSAPAPAAVPKPAPATTETGPTTRVEVEPSTTESGSTEAASPAPAPAPAGAASETDERLKGFVPQLSLAGSIGLLRMSSAEVGSVGQFRLGLHGEYFKSNNFLIQSDSPKASDKNTRLQGALTFGITPVNYLEIFGAVLGSANRNKRLCFTDSGTGGERCEPEANRTDPELIKSFGDLILGAKVAYPVAPGFSAGGELGIRMMSSISGISFSPDSTSLWVNAIGSYDLKPATENVPVRFHANVGYYVDNSDNLVNYETNKTSAFSRYVSRFAYGISQNRFRAALGVDAPFDEVAEGFSIRPMVEYHLEYLTGSKDPVIYGQEHDSCGKPDAGACKDNKDQHWVTLGVQGQILHGLTFTLGLDVSLKSAGYPYAAALAPWNVLFGIGYPVDLVPRIVRNIPVEKVVVKEAPMHEGLVAGRVISSTGTPVEGAAVGVTGREHSRVLTDADGTFQSVPLAPGQVELLIVANGFESATLKTEIIAGQTANVVVRLTPKPPAARAVGRVSDDTGKGIVASIKMAGPQIAEGKSDESGNFTVNVLPGLYALRIDADQFLTKELQLTVADGRENAVSVTLRTRPAVAGVTFQEGKFKLRQPITFKPATKKAPAELAVGMAHLLDEIVDILVNHPEIKQVRVEAHWDSSVQGPKADTMTEEQAKLVAKYLVDQGITSDRVVPVGMGSKKPLVPNLGKGKMKNRRVEFVVGN